MGFLLTNYFVRGPRFEDLKEGRIVEECPCQKSWILGLTLIMMISSLLSMPVVFRKIYFLQDQGLPILCNSSRKKGTFLQDDFFPIITTLVNPKIALNLEVCQICCYLQHPKKIYVAIPPNEVEVLQTGSCFAEQGFANFLAFQ